MWKLQITAISLLLLVLARGEPKLVARPPEKCSLFLAPSTIPHAGLGIFTAIPLEKGETIGHGDVMIPIVDIDVYVKGSFSSMIFNYTWDGAFCGMTRESYREQGVTAFGPGLDGAINCNLALINVGSTLSQWDDAGLHRSRNPGAGAFSQYYNASTKAKSKIPAGGELFKYYGDHWFRGRTEQFGLIPLTDDFAKANEFLRRFHSLFLTNDNLSDDIKRAMYDIARDFPIEGRVLNALPSYDDISQAVANGIESLHQRGAIRSIQELESTGRCLDKIQPGRSTLKEAGRGAFATKHLRAGSVITGSPLIHIPYDEMLLMHDFDLTWNEKHHDFDVYLSDQISGYQLLLNYCWGHAASTVLLCPYSSGVNFINHNQSLVNVALRWAPDGEMSHNSTWLHQTSVNDMEHEFSTKLAMDFVALRDIEPGEELFLDYGDAWEEAWLSHIQLWGQDDSFQVDYLSAARYNLVHKNSTIRTMEEQHIDPYPANLELRCHQDAYQVAVVLRSKVEWKEGETGYACDVLERNQKGHDILYHVTMRDTNGELWNVSGLSRDFFAFHDRPYTTDVHLPWAFRHNMVLPNEMLPQNWKNRIL